MPNWEYKVITSGRGGFATPALLEKFLNDLGQDEWEIIEFRSSAENALAFSGLARRSTERDWTLEDAAAAAARAEADKLRAEFEAKFKGMSPGSPAGTAEESAASPAAATGDDGLRRLRDTESDQDPDAPAEPEDDWDKLSSEDELPSFFDAIRPLLRRNQRGPGLSVGVDQLARKWDFSEDDVKSALVECGFVLPDDEDAKPFYIEYDGDLYWVNVNRRGELWINTREKPRPVFRTVRGNPVSPESEQSPESSGESPASSSAGETRSGDSPRAELPAGPELLARIHPKMRQNRRGPGSSGSTGFLSRAMRCSESDLLAAFGGVGLVVPAVDGDKPAFVEVGDDVWWLNKDQRGGIWINQRRKSDMQDEPAEVSPAPAQAGGSPISAASSSTLTSCRLLMKETKTGGFAAPLDALASEIGLSAEQLSISLVEAGLKVPEKSREKPVFVDHAGEAFWINRNSRDELWLNAKASKFADDSKRRSRGRKPRKDDEPSSDAAAPEQAAPESAV